MTGALELIRKRRSYRMPFDPRRPVEAEKLAQVLEAARWAPTAHNMQNFEIVVVDDPEVLGAIARLARPVSETFVRENYAQLSFSEEELRQKKTGILAAMFPESWRTPDFRLDQLDDEARAAMRRPLPASPVLLVVTYDPGRRAPASEGDFLGIVSLGCVMENMWLAAEAAGLAFHIVSSLSPEPEMRRILAIPDHLTIAFSCRLGHPAAAPPPHVRVRRDVQDFVHHDRYGG